MTNKDIITLGNGGFLRATAHSLPVEHFYKFVKFKRSVQKAYDAISREQQGFLSEAGLKLDDLRDGSAAPEKIDRYVALNDALLAEDSVVKSVRIPAEFYKGIYDENRRADGDLFADPAIEEIILENLFQEEPDHE